MPTGTYAVRAAVHIVRRGLPLTRRRAGIPFAAEETLISTDPNEEGATIVTEAQLAAILDDSNLRPADSTNKAEPGLRAKPLRAAPPAAPTSDEGESGEASPIRRSHHRKA